MGDDDFERIIVLKRTPLFRDLDLGTLTAVAQAVRTRSWLRGDEVVPAGSARRDLLVLESGRLSIDGAPMSAPGCFGEVTLAGETISWPQITALEDSRAGFLAAILFEELQRDHPELLVQLCRHLGHRLRALETRPDRR